MENTESILSDIKPPEIEAGMLQGFFTRLFDFAVDALILILFYLLLPWETVIQIIKTSPYIIPAILIAAATLYRLLFLLLLNKTIGMMLCRVKLLNKDLQPLSNKEKLLSLFRSRFSSIKYYKDTV